jgi:hypothetical protein
VPHGRRSDRVNSRDLEVLAFIGRFGTVPREAALGWSGAGRSVHLDRERRLRLAGLIEVRPDFEDGARLLVATGAGLRACGLRELKVARPSLATVRHETVLARLAARLEPAGETLLSERELLAAERAAGRRIYSAELAAGRGHRPDLVRLTPSGPEAIEVELATKGARRLDAILRAWRYAVGGGRFVGVAYHCAPRTRPFVEAAIGRTSTGRMIEARELQLFSAADLRVSRGGTNRPGDPS